MARLLKVATPLTAATVVVPLRLPPPGLLPIARVMLAVELTRLLPASSSWTVTAGLRAWAAAAGAEGRRVGREGGAPGVTLKGLEVAPARPLLLAARV